MEKVLITGGSGFIGRYFVDRLKQAEVCILDLRKPDYESHAHYISGDVRNVEDLLIASRGCKLIIHLAAMHHDFGIPDEAYFQTNVGGAENLIHAAKANQVNAIINFSSVAVYGNQGNPGPTTEQTLPNPTNPYGKSKLQAEQLFREWVAESDDRKLIQVRSTVVFGPHNLANVLNLIKAIDQGLYFHIGEGTTIKSLAYVENITDASLYALNKTTSGEFLFNYVDYPQLTTREIATMQSEFLGKQIRFRFPLWFAIFLARPFDLAIFISGKNLKVSSKRVKKLCTQTFHKADRIREAGFIPKHETRDGMERMIRWYRNTLKKP